MKFSYLFLIILLFITVSLRAQTPSLNDSLSIPSTNKSLPNDSTLSFWEKAPARIDKISVSPWYRVTYVASPLIVTGLLVKRADTNVRSLRNEYLPKFSKHFDDYTQYLPGAIMLGMKIGGVEGRSSWSRMLTSDLFSVAIMGAMVNTMKTSLKVVRPDGSNKHSFPSGHTATAFMCATMMHREYGLSRSPWYSIGAYSIATATGIGRMLNNRHWFSDVMVGAGVGIISTELGYFFADMLCKDKGLVRKDHFKKPVDNYVHPSFFGLYVGLNILPGEYHLSDGSKLTSSTGSKVGVEGAWFPTTYCGIGGRFSITNMPVLVDNEPLDRPAKTFCIYAGPYFSYPVTSRWLLGSKLLCGYCNFKNDLEYKMKGVEGPLMTGESGRIGFGTGLSLTYLVKQNFGMKFFADYNILPSFATSRNRVLNQLTFGSSANILF